MTRKERLLKYIDYKELTYLGFQQKANLSVSFVINYPDNGMPRRKTIRAISKAYPDFNIKWWIDGEGEMIKPEPTVVNDNTQKNFNHCGNIVDISGSARDIKADSIGSDAQSRHIDELIEANKRKDEQVAQLLEAINKKDAQIAFLVEKVMAK